MNKILWNSVKTPLRYFWVPAGEDVFVGEYQIENGDGEQASVDVLSLAPFEISNEEAEAIMMKELENMTSELGGLFKGLFNLGKRMINSELLDENSEDWDSDEDSDSNDDSDEDSEDLDKIIELFDEDSDSDDDSDSEDGTLEDLIAQFGNNLDGPLSELRDLIAKEVGSLGQELDTLGSEAAKAVDENPGAGQDILRELGQWLINLADEQNVEESSEEDLVVMEFRPKDSDNTNSDEVESVDNSVILHEDDSVTLHEDDSVTLHEDDSVDDEHSSEESSSDSEASNEEGTLSEQAAENQDHTENALDNPKDEATNNPEPVLPSSAELKRFTKVQLVALGEQLGLDMNPKDLKQTLLDQLETLR